MNQHLFVRLGRPIVTIFASRLTKSGPLGEADALSFTCEWCLDLDCSHFTSE
jgi:hypothetical protein